MTIEDLQQICRELAGVTEDIKWEDHLCFNVANKMFLVTSPDNFPPTASFKVISEEFDELASKEGFSPAQYLARYKWIYVDDIDKINRKDWERYIHQSYELIASKLPNKTKRDLGINY